MGAIASARMRYPWKRWQMPGSRLIHEMVALAGAALLGVAGLHPGRAAAAGQGMAMGEMSQGAGSEGAMPQGAMPMSRARSGRRPALDAAALAVAGTQHFTVYVLPGGNELGFAGPDRHHHDTIVPSSFVLRKGVPVTLTVINLDDMRHSITAPGLGINLVVKAGVEGRDGIVKPRTSTYTFTPARAGEFRWFCVFPCDMPTHWAMSASYDGPGRDGFMAGVIRVL